MRGKLPKGTRVLPKQTKPCMIFISIWVNETEIGRGPVWKKKKKN